MINKQVDEMANDYYEAMLKARGTLGSMNEGAPKWYANELYAKGWRKESDVARGIFDEVDKLIYRLLNDVHYIAGDLVWDIKELRKKYESEGTDNDQT